MLEFRILGPLEVVGADGPVRLGGPRQRATLAILLLHAERVVPVDRLADELYAGRPPVTAVTQVQRQVSELRRALVSPSVIETRAPGYVLRLVGAEFDLARFEALAAEAERARAGGDLRRAAELRREALGLWRGTALVDLEDEPFARAAATRLEELRLACLEDRIDLDLGLGRHAGLIGELELLVAEHPLRERLRAQRMLALYRSGRQAEALAAYRDARDALVGAFGIEPSAPLQQLQRAILAQDVSLDVAAASQDEAEARNPTVVVAAVADDVLDGLLAVAEPLALSRGGDVVAARIVAREDDVAAAAAGLAPLRKALGPHVRTAAFTSRDLAADLVRLAVGNDADVVLVAAPRSLDGPQLPPLLADLFAASPAHVGVVAGGRPDAQRGVFVPFGGGEHDWAALEVAAATARATGAAVTLLGTKSDARNERRDASRLLADASLALQRVAGIDAAPVLVDAHERALVEAAAGAGLVVAGVSPRWRQEGIGNWRRALVSGGRLPVLLVHRGPRPGMLAPPESRTRFTWTLAP